MSSAKWRPFCPREDELTVCPSAPFACGVPSEANLVVTQLQGYL